MFLSSSQPGFSAIFYDQVEEPDVTKKVPNLDQTLEIILFEIPLIQVEGCLNLK